MTTPINLIKNISNSCIGISIIIAISVSILLSIPARVTASTAPTSACDFEKKNRCGAAGGCPEGSMCVWTFDGVGECTINTGSCPVLTCGDAGTGNKCGELGGCPEGHQCLIETCILSESRCPAFTPDDSVADDPSLNIFAGPNKSDFEDLNPLRIMDSAYEANFASPAGIINRVLLFAFPLAGLILFVMIVWGGFEMVSGATNSKSLQAGQQRITIQ